jgi:hypothetical protein
MPAIAGPGFEPVVLFPDYYVVKMIERVGNRNPPLPDAESFKAGTDVSTALVDYDVCELVLNAECIIAAGVESLQFQARDLTTEDHRLNQRSASNDSTMFSAV